MNIAASRRLLSAVTLAAALLWAWECPLARAADGNAKPIWLAVAPADLAGAIRPLADLRASEGFQTVISPGPIEKAIAASPRPPAFILLVGDDPAGTEGESWRLPAKRLKLYRWRQAQGEEYASDAAWGDLDGDGIPDVPVGRLPVRTAEQAAAAVAKIVAYERRSASVADLSLVGWAGSPNYDPGLDSMAVGMLLAAVRQNRPAWLEPWLVAADPRHALCGWPLDQPAEFVRRLKQGAMMGVLIGHASPLHFSSMFHANREVRFSMAEANDLRQGPPVAPLVTLSCYSGDFVGTPGCLAASLFALTGGPVATIAATTESHPLTNYYTGVCLLRALGGRQNRLGALWLEAQRSAAKERNPFIERLLKDVEGSLEPEINVARLHGGQLFMYALLGDPATRLALPEKLEITVTPEAGGWRWKAQRPAGAEKVAVALAPAEAAFPAVAPEAAREERQKLFEAANRSLAFEPVPSAAAGADAWQGKIDRAGWLRVVATGGGKTWAGAAELKPLTPATMRAAP
jgi:hypothetical protein